MVDDDYRMNKEARREISILFREVRGYYEERGFGRGIKLSLET
jgi:hypothetical protein